VGKVSRRGGNRRSLHYAKEKGDGSIKSSCRTEAFFMTLGANRPTPKRSGENCRLHSPVSPCFLRLCHAGRDHVERAVCRERSTLLPADDVAGMIAREEDAALGLGPYRIAGRGAGVGATDPGT
jgi:hypothetical protein